MEYLLLELAFFCQAYRRKTFLGSALKYCLSAVFTISNETIQMKGAEFTRPVNAKWKKNFIHDINIYTLYIYIKYKLYISYCKVYLLPFLKKHVVALSDASFNLAIVSIY